MTVLIKNARVIDPHSPFNKQITDIFIRNGIIEKIDRDIKESYDELVHVGGLCISPGWVDVFANFADPGYEYKESIESGCLAAASGGFTDVMVIPNTKPVTDTKSQVEYIIQKAASFPVSVHPIGAVTMNTEGKELAEMYDMRASGAIAFGDGIHCIQSSGLLVKALQYVKAFNGIIIQVPDDKSINPFGMMHEGVVSTRIGLPGKPAMAEELIIARDIKLARYAESRLHFTGISTQKSLEYIGRGKQSFGGISCSVTPYHLFFTDEDLSDYDTGLKVNPPLRGQADREALRKAVMEGVVDCVSTHHMPHEADSKEVEFEYARYGMTGLETAYSIIRMSLTEMEEESLVRLFATNPRSLFGLGSASVSEGMPAVLTMFQPEADWVYSEAAVRSKSKNSPFLGKSLHGKVTGIINKDKVHLNT